MARPWNLYFLSNEFERKVQGAHLWQNWLVLSAIHKGTEAVSTNSLGSSG